jgi:hypothetical protein
MNRKITIASFALAASMAVALTLPTTAFAQHHGSYNGGGGHASGGGGYHGGAMHVGVHPAYNPGYYHSGYHGGYYHGGYYHPYYAHGYYPYYYHYPFYGSLAFGVYVASLPYYYNTFWWGGVPYYYGDGNYYTYDDQVNQYKVVEPPPTAADAHGQSVTSELFVYPKNNQSEDQQRTDRFECHQWAVNQTGFDPTNIDANKGAAIAPDKPADYRRAQTACLNGRGYSVK